jgi:hypothetical protein
MWRRMRAGRSSSLAWIAALAWEALRELGAALPKRFHFAHPRTLRRGVLHRSADVFVTRSHLLVDLDEARGQAWLRPPIRKLNKLAPALPWLDGRRVVMGFATRSRPPDAQPLLPDRMEVGFGPNGNGRGVWC